MTSPSGSPSSPGNIFNRQLEILMLVPERNRYHHNNINKERGSLGLEVTDFIAVISSRLMSEYKWAKGPLFMYM